MSANFYELLKYANTGIASPSMTYFDRMRASSLMGGAVQTLTGIPPLSFTGNGNPLISWSMLGNAQQTGTPSPDNIIMPDFCGKLVGTDWTIPITCAVQTVPVYLGQTQTVRRVKKLVLTGEETWVFQSINDYGIANLWTRFSANFGAQFLGLSSHFTIQRTMIAGTKEEGFFLSSNNALYIRINATRASTTAELKSYLAAQYAAGTPVTVWYVLETPETGTVNEPLAKIGDYADELHSIDAGVTIPTTKGNNTLTVETDLQPSSVTISYKADE